MQISWIEIGALVLLALVAGVSVMMAGIVWKNGYNRGWRMARRAKPMCPNCGYDLSGLTECRCPECGKSFLLNDLWRATIASGAVKDDADVN